MCIFYIIPDSIGTFKGLKRLINRRKPNFVFVWIHNSLPPSRSASD
jgi:hypothetical protein